MYENEVWLFLFEMYLILLLIYKSFLIVPPFCGKSKYRASANNKKTLYVNWLVPFVEPNDESLCVVYFHF